MRLHCPACETAYEVPEEALQPGRLLRCARCRHAWEPVAAEAGAAPAAPAPDDGLPSQDAALPLLPPHAGPSLQADRAGPRTDVLAAWFLTLLLLGSGVAEAVYWRGAIIRAWPPAERVYRMLGLS